MINLLPPVAKKDVQKEYWFRVISAWLLLISGACLIIVLLLLPVYVLVQNQLEAFAAEFNEANVQEEAFSQSEEEVRKVNTIATTLATDNTSATFTTLIEVLQTIAGSGITINSFTFARDAKRITAITISGDAQSRQSLVAFGDAIEANTLFTKAEIPLSNLAKNEDIPFTINIVPNTATQ